MRFQTDLVPARLIRRYKRFLADCRLDDGREVTAHCANPGSMMGLAEPGTRIWLEPNDDPRKKLGWCWRLVDHGGGDFTGVDTAVPNRALREALEARAVAELADYGTVQAEARYGSSSRIDFRLSEPGLPDAWVEVKSVTLSRRPGLAEFPDSVTARGAKHLCDLAALARSGQRAIMLFLVQRTDCTELTLAGDIDPAYLAAFRSAREAGVDVLALRANITTQQITVGDRLRFRL